MGVVGPLRDELELAALPQYRRAFLLLELDDSPDLLDEGWVSFDLSVLDLDTGTPGQR